MAGYYTLDVADINKQRKGHNKQPFPHQKESFKALSKTLPIPIKGYAGTLLVLPTGGGKTYTSINWICRNVLSKRIKVLWMAQSSYLIDQAADTFINEIHNAVGRDIINLRVVSSSKNHSNSGSISMTDDILVCTTQTAISAYSSEQLDGMGNIVWTPFRKFIDTCKETELFIVVDEAHHTPAYGCRTLLLSIRDEIKNLFILGLTATPMHMDKRISGWLRHIYDKWICYEADKNVLQANKVLSVPKYIEKDTGMEFEVDDGLFDRLVHKHKDLPDSIVEYLANNQSRNNFIISDYLNNRPEYGKTLIFADRWFQCEYLVEKLKNEGVRANAVYSIVTGQDEVYRSGSGRRNDEMNRQIMQDFRDGKYDVIVNVRMLTEGVDVPDVKTVMITRQTTSNILLTQMIGRALRGEKAGGGTGKGYANVVLFNDTWKRLLPWANVLGGTEEGQPPKQGRNPMTLISIQLIKMATADIEYTGFENAGFITFIPVGFFGCEYTIAIEDGSTEELVSFAESVIVYEFNKEKYMVLMDFLANQDLTPYATENLTELQALEKAEDLAKRFFNMETDNFDDLLIENIAKIIRHVAQNNVAPPFVDFHERDSYDLDKVADELLNTPPLDADIILTNKFNDMGLHWNFLYKCFDNFMDAYYKAQKRVLVKRRGQPTPPEIRPPEATIIELTEEMKRQVFARDNYICLCCGKERRRGVRLNVDHIRPVSMGGTNDISNLQTLCRLCNTKKSVNEINFRVHVTPLRKPKSQLEMVDYVNSDFDEHAVARIVNVFYHCAAVCAVNYHQKRSGRLYSAWEIVLFVGNNPDWLKPYTKELLGYIHTQLGQVQVTELIIRN
ncbi:MAG: DEAD/DEAH box helicase family protein [Oscillospiraceae bacterium]|nr:DEAD/DEAH box helicase family protein [Oscillospiraceae bacterium]